MSEWLPRWHWGTSLPGLPALRFYGLHWGIVAIGKWRYTRGYTKQPTAEHLE